MTWENSTAKGTKKRNCGRMGMEARGVLTNSLSLRNFERFVLLLISPGEWRQLASNDDDSPMTHRRRKIRDLEL